MQRKAKRRMTGCITAAVLMFNACAGLIGVDRPVWAAGDDAAFAQEFSEPSISVRPKIRWWIPGSHMTKDEIRAEIASMAEAGFGGAEIVPVSAGGGDGEDIDWGTEQWNEMIKFMLQTAGEFDFTIDFTMTPAWPLALPTITDVDDPSQGAQMELDGASVDGITTQTPYEGEVPITEELDAGTPQLLAVTVAKYMDKANKVLDYSSACTLEIGKEVIPGENGATDYTVSFKPEDDGEYVLFGWWQHPSGNVKYGNYQLDHYGKAASQALIDYWETYLLPYYGEDFKNASALFIDSLEYRTHLDWTIGLLDQFESIKNYNLAAYLPAVYDTDARGDYQGDPQPDFTFEQKSEEIKNDFKDVLTQLYIENHLKPLSDFCDSIGVDLRYQTAYGKNLELAQTAMYVDIPETETLYGKDIVDFYRYQSGAAHMADKRVYSIEASAELNMVTPDYTVFRGNGEEDASNYQQTWEDQLWHIQRAFAGGVNQIVFHGYSYNGQYEGEGNENGYVAGTSWPGFECFGYNSFSNSWGERLPSWKHASDYLNYIARNQYILRQGEAKVDVGVYRHSYWEPGDFNNPEKAYQDEDALKQNGFTYEFLSPSAFELENAVVERGVLDINGPAYKALIFDNENAIPGVTADTLIEYAKDGLPIIFIGDMPREDAYAQGADIAGKMAELKTYDSVRVIEDSTQAAETLKEMNIKADAGFENENLLTVHRYTKNADFYYLYNEGNTDDYPAAKNVKDIDAYITLKGEGKPYLLNTWNGEIIPIADYTAENGAVTIHANIGGNSTMVVALAKDGWYQGEEVVNAAVSAGDLHTEYAPDGSLIVKSTEAGEYSFTLSDGQKISIEAEQAPDVLDLSAWDLTVESWLPGSTPSETVKTNVEVGKVEGLRPWKEIEGLENVSGIGTYNTTFNLEKGWDEGVGAIIELGDVVDTYRITVNGTTLSTDQIDTTVDIGPWLQAGENTISVEVASTLLNAVITAYPEDIREMDEYGILGKVTLTPYTWNTIVEA